MCMETHVMRFKADAIFEVELLMSEQRSFCVCEDKTWLPVKGRCKV